ncbi:MAG: lysophospholipid acyltransferase family protein [Kovacikia sp.]
MQAQFRVISAFKTFFDLWMRATSAPSDSLNGWSFEDRDPQVIQQLIPLLNWFYQDYFHAQTSGWEHIPQEGKVLLIGSHNGGLAAPDLYMIMHDWYEKFGVDRPTYALMNPTIWKAMPGLARLATQVGALRAHPKMALAALHRNTSLLIYPGGAQDVFRPYSERNKIHFYGRHGFIKLALQTETPIIPLISHGAHATLIVLTDIYPQLQRFHQLGLPWLFGIDPEVCPIYLGLPWGVAIGPLPNIPLPVQIHTRVCPPIVFERYGDRAAQDKDYVNACYDRVLTLMQAELDQLTQQVSRSTKPSP